MSHLPQTTRPSNLQTGSLIHIMSIFILWISSKNSFLWRRAQLNLSGQNYFTESVRKCCVDIKHFLESVRQCCVDFNTELVYAFVESLLLWRSQPRSDLQETALRTKSKYTDASLLKNRKCTKQPPQRKNSSQASAHFLFLIQKARGEQHVLWRVRLCSAPQEKFLINESS